MKHGFKLFNGKKRFFSLFTLIFAVFFIVIGRLVWLQIVRGDSLAKQSMSQALGTDVMYSPRGAIVDCNGEELAVSIMAKSLYVDPLEMEDRPDSAAAKSGRNVKRLAADLLAAPLGISADSLYSDFTRRALLRKIKYRACTFWRKASATTPKRPWRRRFWAL